MSETETLGQPGDNTAAPNEAESRAKRLGWVPLEDFKGDPNKHRSAEEFLERGETLLPILKRDNDKLHEGMSRLERRLADQEKTFGQFAEFATKAEERAYKRALSELEAKRDAAIETADVNAAKSAQRQIDELNKDAAAVPKVTKTEEQPAVDPTVSAWIRENDWFDKDPALRGFALKVFDRLEKATPGRAKSEMLAETKQKVMEKFPEDFGINPKREGAGAVNEPGGGTAPRKKSGKTYEDLPAEAKKACDKFVRTIPNYTRDKYVKDYEWD